MDEQHGDDTTEDNGDLHFQARLYQEELFEISCKHNTIICLNTGAGKTFIAIMLIKEKQHEITKSFTEDSKRTIFLAPTVPLVIQQASVIRNHTNLKVGEYYGTKGVDGWDHEKWHQELVANEVLAMTPKVLVNMLKDSSVKLINRINLLIFDECHNATGNSDYCEVLRRYGDFDDPPLILGLTASVLNGKCKPCKVEMEMGRLETAFFSRIVSARNLDTVYQHATKPKEMVIVCSPMEETSNIKKEVGKVLTKQIKAITELKKASKKRSSDEVNAGGEIQNGQNLPAMEICCEEDDASDLKQFTKSALGMLKDANVTLHALGLCCTKSLVDSFLEEMPELKEKAQEQLLEEKVRFLCMVEDSFHDAQQIWESHFPIVPEPEAAVLNITPRVRRLLELLRALCPTAVGDVQQSQHAAFRGIVFVEQRITAWALARYLRELAERLPDAYGNLRPCYVVGHGGNGNFTARSSMNVKLQSIALQSFRTGSCNLLVATQVAEEGLDIPKCNAVIRFDLPKNFASYVQSMGRARAEKALYILLVEASKKLEVMEFIATIKEIESILNLKIPHHDQAIVEDEERDVDYLPLKPYYPTTKDGACVTLNTALDTLYRYCNFLPHDRYSKLCPKFVYKREGDGSVCCSITLPFGAIGVSCFLEPIVGIFVTNKKLARKAAALKACERLHKEGELNDNLKPAKNYVQRYAAQLGIVLMEDHEKHLPMPGTRKRRQAYDKKVADDLRFAFPLPEKSLYLHAICIESEVKDGIIDCQSCYGILSSKPISDVYPFKLYGKATHTMKLQCLTNDITIDKLHLSALEEFHCFLFQDVLNLATEALEYCPQNVQFSFLIVPIARNQIPGDLIDWDLVSRCLAYRAAADADARPELPRVGDVVLPQYGEDHLKNRRFHVLQVCYELSPRSPLAGFGSYADYVKVRYDRHVTNHDQPLLLVDYTPNTLNVLHPRLPKDPAGKARRQQHQIPELCRIYPLDIQSVTHAFFLPSILHRINGLLLARQLWDQMTAEANLPLDASEPAVSLPPLEATCKASEITDTVIFSHNDKTLSATSATTLGALVFQALTTSSAANWSDMERLEVVGDSFLKFSVSAFLFCIVGVVNEGGLTTLRTGLVSNFNLYSHARAKDLPALLNATTFQPRLTWLPPCFHIPEALRQALRRAHVQRHLWPHAAPSDVGNFSDDSSCWIAELKQRWSAVDPALRDAAADNAGEEQGVVDDASSEDCIACDYYTQQVVGDKTVADSAEAIIGAVLLSCGQKAALRLIDWLGLKVHPDDYPWNPPATAQIVTQPQETLNRIYAGLDKLEEQLGYTFKEISFLRQALVHPSYTKEPVTDNYQRLEFLGDAVLDFLVTMQLYKMNPDLSPGEMTDLRSSLVDNATFGYLSVKSGLHKHLKYSNSNLFKVIDRFIKHAEGMQHPKDALYLIKEDETVELEEIEIPKALGDVFEAIAGAIFVDSGLSLKAVWNVYYPMMKDFIERYSKILPINPVRVLLETFSDTKFSKPTKRGSSFVVEVLCKEKTFSGLGNKKEFAKQAAAKAALRAFNIAPEHELCLGL